MQPNFPHAPVRARRRCFVPGAGGLRGGGAGLRAARRGPSRCLEHAAAGRRQRIGSGSLVARVPGSLAGPTGGAGAGAQPGPGDRAPAPVAARAERDQAASRRGRGGRGRRGVASRSSTALRYPPGLGETRTYRLALDASWEIDVFGGRRRALEAADAQAQAEEGRALRVSLLAELASSYVALRSAQERQRIALDTVASLETARRLAQTLRARPGLGRGGGPGARGAGTGQARRRRCARSRLGWRMRSAC